MLSILLSLWPQPNVMVLFFRNPRSTDWDLWKKWRRETSASQRMASKIKFVVFHAEDMIPEDAEDVDALHDMNDDKRFDANPKVVVHDIMKRYPDLFMTWFLEGPEVPTRSATEMYHQRKTMIQWDSMGLVFTKKPEQPISLGGHELSEGDIKDKIIPKLVTYTEPLALSDQDMVVLEDWTTDKVKALRAVLQQCTYAKDTHLEWKWVLSSILSLEDHLPSIRTPLLAPFDARRKWDETLNILSYDSPIYAIQNSDLISRYSETKMDDKDIKDGKQVLLNENNKDGGVFLDLPRAIVFARDIQGAWFLRNYRPHENRSLEDLIQPELYGMKSVK